MNRLRSYRMIEGIAQEQLGELLGLSTQMISAIEGGRRIFGGDLSALGYANDRFYLPDMSEPLHRQRASTKAATRKRATELVRLAGEVFGELQKRTPKAPATLVQPSPPPTSLGELDDFAVEVRYILRHEQTGPIRNLTSLIERAGICLVPIIGLGVDGISAWVGDVPVIGLAPNVPGDRFRLTLGHELAHLLFHTRATPTAEHEANRFAVNLLFPQEAFEELLPARPQLKDFIAMKSAWGVSVAALVYRAHDLDIIDDSRYRSLQIQMSKWRRSEPGEFEPAHGELLNRLVELNGGLTSVASNLGVNRGHLEDLLRWSPRPHLRLARSSD